MEAETKEAIELVEANLETINNDNATEVETAVALEQLANNAQSAFKSHANANGWDI